MQKKLIFPQFAIVLLCFVPRFFYAENLYFPLSFDQAMVSDEEHREQYVEFKLNTPHQKLLNLIENQYYQFIDIVKQIPQSLKIPKIIHQIWIGPLPFPQEAREWQESWSKLYPDWEYKLWTNKEVESFEFENKQYYEQATNWGEKSDILRYEILYLYGGLYVDVDFECLRASSLDELHRCCDFYTGIHMVPLLVKNRLRINNGLIAARPQHHILAHAREQIQYFTKEKGVAQRTGPDFFTSVIGDILPTSLAAGSIDMVFPSNFFYPSGPIGGPGFKIQAGQAYVQPETLAVHYYTAFWIVKPQKKTDPKKLERRYQDYLDKKKARKLTKANLAS